MSKIGLKTHRIIAEKKESFVIYAAKNGNLDMVKSLLANGKIDDEQRDPAYVQAYKLGHYKICQALDPAGDIVGVS